MMPYETTAKQVRTGYVICVPSDGYRRSLEVDYPIWGRHTDPVTGETRDVIWFAGWASDGVPVDRGWGQSPDAMVTVVTDLGEQECAFQSI
jgi:hypothetical protein